MKYYLSDKTVGGGVRGSASVGALESALPLGVLSLRGGGGGGKDLERKGQTHKKRFNCVTQQ